MTTKEQPEDDFPAPPFEIIEPARWWAPIVFNSPHSGSHYPIHFLRSSRLDLATLRKSEDSFVDEFIIGLAERGFAVMRARFPRSYIDVNREPYELDPRMYSSRLPSYANTRSMRVAGGLGTIPRVVGDAQEIYRERISAEDARRRIEALYKPYHRELRRLISPGAAPVRRGDSRPNRPRKRAPPARTERTFTPERPRPSSISAQSAVRSGFSAFIFWELAARLINKPAIAKNLISFIGVNKTKNNQ